MKKINLPYVPSQYILFAMATLTNEEFRTTMRRLAARLKRVGL